MCILKASEVRRTYKRTCKSQASTPPREKMMVGMVFEMQQCVKSGRIWSSLSDVNVDPL